MLNVWKKVFALLTAFCMICCCFGTVRADEIEDSSNDNSDTWVILPGVEPNKPVIGGDGGGIGEPETLHEIFTITAAGVCDLLTSNDGNKSFLLSDLDSSASTIVCIATLDHSDREQIGYNLNNQVQFGVCYYNYDYWTGKGEYDSVYTISLPYEFLGCEYSGSFSIADHLESNVTYYSHVKHHYPSGSVSGTYTIYWEE